VIGVAHPAQSKEIVGKTADLRDHVDVDVAFGVQLHACDIKTHAYPLSRGDARSFPVARNLVKSAAATWTPSL
jgi:hypothetical protein